MKPTDIPMLTCALLLASVAGAMTYHASLIRSRPAANSTLSVRPDSLRLVYSEQVVPDLSEVTLRSPKGISLALTIANDPHDSHTLIGVFPAGAFENKCTADPCIIRYAITWRVVAGDGHKSSGVIPFAIAGTVPTTHTSASAATPGSSQPESLAQANPPLTDTRAASAPPSNEGVPLLAAILRAVGLGAMMAAVGLLFFARSQSVINRWLKPITARLLYAAGIFLAAHAVAWVFQIATPQESFGSAFTAAMSSHIGVAEMARAGIAIVAALAVAVGARSTVAYFLGVLCLVVSGAVGHSATIMAAWTMPTKVAHLLFGAIWFGGLVWLSLVYNNERASMAIESRRVSSAALYSLILVSLSGVIQARFFLSSWGDLTTTTYGRLVLMKVLGVLILLAYGAYNRFKLVPAIEGEATAATLARIVKQEIIVMIALILVGGILAYTATPGGFAR